MAPTCSREAAAAESSAFDAPGRALVAWLGCSSVLTLLSPNAACMHQMLIQGRWVGTTL